MLADQSGTANITMNLFVPGQIVDLDGVGHLKMT